MSPLAVRRALRFGLASVLALLALCAAIALGAFDRFSSDGRLDRSLWIPVLVAWWLILATAGFALLAVLRRPREALLAVVTFLLCLPAAELACRLLLPRTTGLPFLAYRSSVFHHVYARDAHIYVGRDGRADYLVTNADGLRTHYTPETFRRYEERVVVLGDSFTLGIGVSNEETFPARLEAQLREGREQRSVAVLNAGIASYSPLIERILLQKVVSRYQPTTVVLMLDATDIGDDYKYEDVSTRVGDEVTFAVRDTPLPTYRGALFELVRPHLPRLRPLWAPIDRLVRRLFARGADEPERDVYEYYDFEVRIGDSVETNRFFIYRHPPDLTRPFFERTMAHIDEVAELSARLGARFVLFVSPRFQHWNPQECPENWERDLYALEEPYQYEYLRYFAGRSATRDYPIVDLLPDFQASEHFPLVFPDDPHWNTTGNEFVAEVVARHLAEHGL